MHEHVQQKAYTHPHAKLSSIHNEYNANALMHELAHTCNRLSSNNVQKTYIFALGHELTHSHTADKKVHKSM